MSALLGDVPLHTVELDDIVREAPGILGELCDASEELRSWAPLVVDRAWPAAFKHALMTELTTSANLFDHLAQSLRRVMRAATAALDVERDEALAFPEPPEKSTPEAPIAASPQPPESDPASEDLHSETEKELHRQTSDLIYTIRNLLPADAVRGALARGGALVAALAALHANDPDRVLTLAEWHHACQLALEAHRYRSTEPPAPPPPPPPTPEGPSRAFVELVSDPALAVSTWEAPAEPLPGADAPAAEALLDADMPDVAPVLPSEWDAVAPYVPPLPLPPRVPQLDEALTLPIEESDPNSPPAEPAEPVAHPVAHDGTPEAPVAVAPKPGPPIRFSLFTTRPVRHEASPDFLARVADPSLVDASWEVPAEPLPGASAPPADAPSGADPTPALVVESPPETV
jgi:hypothetical protein